MPGLTIYPPFGSNTSTDKNGLIILSAILSTMMGILTLPFTLFRKEKSFGWSDAAACLATVLSIIVCIPLLLARSKGLGVSSALLEGNQSQNAKYVLWSEGMYIAALGAYKCWMVSFVWRLSGSTYMPKFKRACGACLAGDLLWTIGSIAEVVAGCYLPSMLKDDQLNNQCPFQFSRWLAICVIDAITDVGTFGLCAWLIWPLHLERMEKFSVILSFVTKLCCVPISVVHLISVQNYNQSSDPGIAVVAPIVWQNAQLGWAALSSAAPSMLWMRRSFNIIATEEEDRILPSMFGNGGAWSGGRSGGSGGGSGPRSGGNNSNYHQRASIKQSSSDWYPLRRIQSDKIPPGRQERGESAIRLRNDKSNYKAKVQALPRVRSGSSGSSESESNLIRIEVSTSVDYKDDTERIVDSPWP